MQYFPKQPGHGSFPGAWISHANKIKYLQTTQVGAKDEEEEEDDKNKKG
jgi:hypothetical protein